MNGASILAKERFGERFSKSRVISIKHQLL